MLTIEDLVSQRYATKTLLHYPQ